MNALSFSQRSLPVHSSKPLGWQDIEAARYLLPPGHVTVTQGLFTHVLLLYLGEPGLVVQAGSTHAGASGIALLIRPFQFLTRLRTRNPLVHRTIGRTYLMCVLIGSVFAFFSALFSVSGFTALVGFAFLSVIWFYSAYKAYRAIRQRHIQLHRVWMICNYALTFAAVILRLWLGLGAAVLHLSFTDVYLVSSWVSWILPLVVAEWCINQRLLQSLALKRDHQDNQQPVIQETVS